MQKIVNDTGLSSVTTTAYDGDFVYENGTLQFFAQPEGFVAPDGSGGYEYLYQYKDHLNNVRLSYTDANHDGQITVSSDSMVTEIVEENNYYPFGLKHLGYNYLGTSPIGNSNAQKFKFGGKELDESFGINTYDFGARNYDPALGRWMNIDPLAENYINLSPFNYAANNPIYFVDPDGRGIIGNSNAIYGSPCPDGDCPEPPSTYDWLYKLFDFITGIGRGKDEMASRGTMSVEELDARDMQRLKEGKNGLKQAVNDNMSGTLSANARISYGPQAKFGENQIGIISQQLVDFEGQIEFRILDGVNVNYNVNTDRKIINRAGLGLKGAASISGEYSVTFDDNGDVIDRETTISGEIFSVQYRNTENSSSDRTSGGISRGGGIGILLVIEGNVELNANIDKKKK